MQDERFKTVWFFGVMLLILALYFYSDYQFSYAHEMAHKAIFSYYGIDSEITVSLFGDSYTQGNVTQLIDLYEFDPNLYSSLVASQSVVDAFGYQLSIIHDAFFIALIVIVVFLFLILSTLDDIANSVEAMNRYCYYREINNAIGGYYGVKELS